jgi:DNA-directed RNA polymerase sigma subunit (sigma70/sigma32)
MAEIGKTIGLSRERVRQIERAAIERLRVQLNQAAA